MPLHLKGAEHSIDIFAGDFLDLEQMPRVQAEVKRTDPFSRAAKDMGAGEAFHTEGLKAFAAKSARSFDAAEFFRDCLPDWVRSGSGGKITVRCPQAELHSDGDNPADVACIAVNACDADQESFVITCRHDACAGVDRLHMLDLACVEAGITSSDKLRPWVAETVEDAPGLEGFATLAEARTDIAALAKGHDDSAISVVRRIGATCNFSAGQSESLLKQIKLQTGLGLRSLEAERKSGAKAVRERGRRSDLPSLRQ